MRRSIDHVAAVTLLAERDAAAMGGAAGRLGWKRQDVAEGYAKSMGFEEFLGSIPAALVPVALVLYFSDQNTKNWMNERKETVLAILSERKEWLQERKDTLERQFAMQERTVTEIASAKGENHALRNALTANTNRLEALDLHIQALTKGSSGND